MYKYEIGTLVQIKTDDFPVGIIGFISYQDDNSIGLIPIKETKHTKAYGNSPINLLQTVILIHNIKYIFELEKENPITYESKIQTQD